MEFNKMENNQSKLIQMQDKKKQIQTYLSSHVNSFIQPLIYDIVMQRPADPAEFSIEWLKGYVEKRQQPKSTDSDSDCDIEEEPFDQKKLLKRKEKKISRRGISEEVFGAFNAKQKSTIRCIPKSQEDKILILSLIRNSILFQNLDENDEKIIIDAMEEKVVEKDDKVISEGDKGDSLYIVAEGDFDCLKVIGGEEKYLKTYHKGQAFGELALMYNAPRAATIISQGNGKLYALDRIAFSQIVKTAAIKKRQLYEKVMNKVEIFSELSQYEREQFYDVLKAEKYDDGDYIIKQGENGNQFYIVIEGTLVAEKKEKGDELPKIVYQYKEGDYFGELALLHDQPRQASIKALGKVQVARIERDTFKRLLGSLEDILKRNEERYKNFQSNIAA